MDVILLRNNIILVVLFEIYIFWYLNEKVYVKNKLVIIFFLISMIVGMVGNGFVIYVYGWWFCFNFFKNIFIIWLVVFDLIFCCVIILFEVFDLCFLMLYGEGIICKIFWILVFVVNIILGLIFVLIVFDRF